MSLKKVIRGLLPKIVIDMYHMTRCRMGMLINRLRYSIGGVGTTDPKTVPIVINNFNRLTFLQKLIGSLECRGYSNIYIIDNASTYPPLLDYYDRCPYKVFRLEKNIGYLSIWETGIYDMFKKSFYVYTDSDMQIDESCPDDFMARFINVMQEHPMAQKVGFGLRIDDLPDHFKNKDNVLMHEARFWERPVADNLYAAEIDTTFALYRPYCKGKADRYQETYRTGGRYVIRHLPWYVDSSSMTEEEQYYINSITKSTHWSQQA